MFTSRKTEPKLSLTDHSWRSSGQKGLDWRSNYPLAPDIGKDLRPFVRKTRGNAHTNLTTANLSVCLSVDVGQTLGTISPPLSTQTCTHTPFSPFSSWIPRNINGRINHRGEPGDKRWWWRSPERERERDELEQRWRGLGGGKVERETKSIKD